MPEDSHIPSRTVLFLPSHSRGEMDVQSDRSNNYESWKQHGAAVPRRSQLRFLVCRIDGRCISDGATVAKSAIRNRIRIWANSKEFQHPSR
jgi:hypothetical protein